MNRVQGGASAHGLRRRRPRPAGGTTGRANWHYGKWHGNSNFRSHRHHWTFSSHTKVHAPDQSNPAAEIRCLSGDKTVKTIGLRDLVSVRWRPKLSPRSGEG